MNRPLKLARLGRGWVGQKGMISRVLPWWVGQGRRFTISSSNDIYNKVLKILSRQVNLSTQGSRTDFPILGYGSLDRRGETQCMMHINVSCNPGGGDPSHRTSSVQRSPSQLGTNYTVWGSVTQRFAYVARIPFTTLGGSLPGLIRTSNIRKSLKRGLGTISILTIGRLEGIIGGKVKEVCGEGMEGLTRVIERYRKKGGIYAFWNEDYQMVYVGSSSDLSRRMLGYRSNQIRNRRLRALVASQGWNVLSIIVVLLEGDEGKRLEMEYGMIRGLREGGIKIYNIFQSREEHEEFGERMRLLRKERAGGEGWSNNIREKLSKIAKERGYGEKLKGYWFKKGEEHYNAREIWVIDLIEGVTFSGIKKEMIKRMGGSKTGVFGAMKDGRVYKKRYILRDKPEAYAEVIIEDKKTGDIQVMRKKDAPGMVGGTERGIRYAIKKGNKYKGRYLIRDLKVGE